MTVNEYFRFSRACLTWNEENLIAEPRNYSEDHLKIQREWWYGKPLSMPVPKLSFAIQELGPFPDNYWNSTLFDLYSPRLITILKHAGIANELFPVEMVGKNTGKVLSVGYQVFRLLEVIDALDRAKSVFRYETRHGRSVEYLEKPVYKEEFLDLKKPLLRIQGFASIVIIHANLKSLLEEEGITGCSYSPL